MWEKTIAFLCENWLVIYILTGVILCMLLVWLSWIYMPESIRKSLEDMEAALLFPLFVFFTGLVILWVPLGAIAVTIAIYDCVKVKWLQYAYVVQCGMRTIGFWLR